MPIDLGSVLKQIGRDFSQTLGPNGADNSFYYLIETADIDFRVDGRIGVGGLLPSGDDVLPTTYFGQKFIVEDISGLTDVGISVSGVQNGDIIEKRADGWYVHLDVSAEGSPTPLRGTNGGALAYSKTDKKFYYYKDATDGWVELGEGSLTGAAGETWSIQFRAADGSLSGDAGLLFNNDTNQLVLGSNVVIAFGDGTTQGTARNFYGITGPTAPAFPLGMSGAGNTGDRLLIATGSSADPFRNYVKFGNAWFQTGVVGIGQGPQGIQGTAGATGETGATGATGARGETGYGFTAAFVSGDGELYISTLFPSGESGNERSIGLVRGNDGAAGDRGETGSTGSTGYGFTAAFVSGDGNLYISTLFPSGESGDERSIGFVRGETGATGRFSIGLTVAEEQDYDQRTSSFLSGEVGIARKVAFLLENGSLTFDYVKNIDIFNQSQFQFAALSFSINNFGQLQLMSGQNYLLDGNTFTASYRLPDGSPGPLTGNIYVESVSEGIGFPLFFPTTAMNAVSANGLSVTGSAGGANGAGLLFRLRVTGNDAGGQPRYDASRTYQVNFRNHYLSGMTSAPGISGGSTGMESTWWSTKDYGLFASQPRNEELSGYKVLLTPTVNNSFIYFAYPSRIHSESLNGNSFYIYNEGGARQLAGGMVLQGYGEAVDAGGLSTLNYTNQASYTEPYKVWRSEKSFSPGQGIWLEIG